MLPPYLLMYLFAQKIFICDLLSGTVMGHEAFIQVRKEGVLKKNDKI